MKRKALGKGLSALLGDTAPAAPPSGSLDVPLESLEANPYQPRTVWDPARIDEMAASIRATGIIQPILVRRRAGGRYQIIAGERRWRAAQAAGLRTVPIAVRDVSDDRLLEMALVENIQREELSALEEAQAFQRLLEEFELTQEEVARRVGRERSTVANTIRLLRLPRVVRELLAAGAIEAGHARALLALDKPEDQVALGKLAAEKGLSVREVERRAAELRGERKRPAARRKDPNTRAAEERLRSALGARVEIRRRGKAGVLAIAFTGEEELNRLFELLLRKARS
jgi:ParB family chromosome partitioning protein